MVICNGCKDAVTFNASQLCTECEEVFGHDEVDPIVDAYTKGEEPDGIDGEHEQREAYLKRLASDCEGDDAI